MEKTIGWTDMRENSDFYILSLRYALQIQVQMWSRQLDSLELRGKIHARNISLGVVSIQMAGMVGMSPPNLLLKYNCHCDSFRKWSPWEVIAMRVSSSWMDGYHYHRSGWAITKVQSPFSHVGMCSLPWDASAVGLPCLRNHEPSELLLFFPQTMVFCYSSRKWTNSDS